MSILIKDREMPTRCADCLLEYDGILCRATGNSFVYRSEAEGGYVDFCDTRMPDCPLFEVPEWIPVTDRLPEGKDGNYIVAIKTSRGIEVHEAYYYKAWDSYEWYDPVEEYQKYDVTHWMPLPKPPKDGDA